MKSLTALEPLMLPEEVAAHLRIPETRLRDWRHKGEGPAFVKAGKDVRYHPHDVLAFENANREIPVQVNQ